jgi:hypothetical protein
MKASKQFYILSP